MSDTKNLTPVSVSATQPDPFKVAVPPGLDPAGVEFLLQQSQILWREPSYDRLLQRFAEQQVEHFGLYRMGLFFIRNQNGKLNLQPAGLEFKATAAVKYSSLMSFEIEFTIDQLKSQEMRQGMNIFATNHSSFSFVLLGDPAVDWQILILEYTVTESTDLNRARSIYGDFFARQLQSACTWFQRLDKTQALLYKDDLTGVFNSRFLEQAIENEIRRSSRFQTSFCLLFIDLDNFKTINDKFGHLAGSSVLRQLAEVLREAAREIDSVIRYGGDEFVILLLGANSNTGLLAAERIRRKVEDARFYLDDGNYISLTASIGVASYPEHATNRESLLKIADEMMYASKKQGKNRVTLFKDKPEIQEQPLLRVP